MARAAVVDVGIANLGSICRVIGELGHEAAIVRDGGELAGHHRIILPGVGNFTTAMARLDDAGLTEAIRDAAASGKPVMGICLGMQLLATKGREGGERAGLGLISGLVKPLKEFGCTERVPHMGWNSAHFRKASPFLAEVPDGTDFYFVHSYAFDADDPEDILASTNYGVDFPSMINRGNVFGTQFHPEKSSRLGFRLLQNFMEYPPC